MIQELPFLVRAFNFLGNLCARLGLYQVDLSKEGLVQEAIRSSGIDGPLLSGSDKPLDILLEAIQEEAELDFFGKFMARGMLLDCISNGLRVEEMIDRHKEIDRSAISQPIFVVGFPRTGTTLLQNLLATDPKNRTPQMWETLNPAPVFENRNRPQAKLVRDAQKLINAMYFLTPEVQRIHPFFSEGPDECLKLLERTFVSPHFYMYFNIPSYWSWLLSEQGDVYENAYLQYLKQLKILQWYENNDRWLLKTPIHQFFLETIFSVFPGAQIIQLHRDPKVAIPSFCSLARVNRKTFSSTSDHQLGDLGLSFFVEGMNRAFDARNAHEGQIIDVAYSDLVANPKETVQSIYSFFDYDLNDELITGVDTWLTENPQNKHGAHRYDLEEFGLTPEIVDSSTSFYMEKFGKYC